MFQGSATDELDRLIAQAGEAREALGQIIAGMSPDDHGVVTTSAEAGAEQADHYRTEVNEFETGGLAVASFIDDLYPETSGSYRELADLVQTLRDSLDAKAVGHADEELMGADGHSDHDTVDEAPAEPASS